MKKVSLVLLLLAVTVSLCGCYNYEEIDTRGYPIALAVNKGDKKEIELGMQFSIKNDKGKESKNTETVIKAEGNNIFDAYETLDNITGKSLSPSQLKILIISKEFAESGIKEMIFDLANSQSDYSDLFVVLTDGDAIEYLDKQQIWLENTPSKFYKILFERSQKSYYNMVKIPTMAFDFIAKNEELVIPYITFVKDNIKGESKSNIENSGENKKKFEENEVQSVTPQKAEISQLGIFRDGKLIDTIKDEQVAAYGILKSNYRNGYLNVPVGDNDYVNLTIQNRMAPKVDVKFENGKPTISISIKIDAFYIESVEPSKSTDEILRQSEKYIEKICLELLNNSTEKWKADILGFSGYAARKFKTVREFKEYDWRKKYEDAEFDIEVTVKNFNDFKTFGVF